MNSVIARKIFEKIYQIFLAVLISKLGYKVFYNCISFISRLNYKFIFIFILSHKFYRFSIIVIF